MFKFFKLIFKEFHNFIHFFWKTSKIDKKIVFYAEHEGYYPYFEGFIKKLTEEYRQNVCYITSDPNDPILQTSNTKIKPLYFKKLLPIFMVYVNCKAFVMTLTDLNQLLLKRSINPVHYVYAFHSLVSTHMVYRHGAFDYYDSLLCVGPYQVKEIRKHETLYDKKPKLLVEAGYYRLERIYNAYQNYKQKNTSTKNKPTILIAPSWGVDNVLESCGNRLIEILLNAGFEVIVRPHPETVRRSYKLIEMFKNNFGANPDFNLELSVATDDSLLRSDVLISDFSGITLEYAFGTERPVLFLDIPMKVRNQRYEEIGIESFEVSVRSEIGIILSPDKLDNITQVVNKLIQEKEFYKNRIMELRRKNIYVFGNSSKISAQFITNLVDGKDIKRFYNTVPADSE